MSVPESINVNAFLQHLKEKDNLENAYTKQIRENESIVQAEEKNIKQLAELEKKLTENLEKKLIENSRLEIKHEILQHGNLIWTDLLEKTRKELKEEEEKMDELLQSIYLNRISFCESTKDFLDKTNFLNISNGFVKRNESLMTVEKKIKTEKDSEERNYFATKIKNLETQLEELRADEERFEEAKLYKVQLQSEPTCGENFLRLQDLLKDMKDKLQNVDMETKAVKDNITQKELLLLKRRNTAKQTEYKKQRNSQDLHQEDQTNLVTNNAKTSWNIKQKQSEVKRVQFKNTVEVNQISSLSQLKHTVKSTSFKAKSPSPSLRKRLNEKILLQLDEEMKEILFKNKE
uniref:Uncharacterized protein n=2 Tax=Cuerna arida TaxID=1464854 RepID=A0A1B6FAK5_9HEMI